LSRLLRTLFAVVLLLGSFGGDWALGQNEQKVAPHSCCCGMAQGMEDTCPCPKPEGNRTPANGGACTNRQPVTAPLVAACRAESAQRRIEPRPEPATRISARNEALEAVNDSHSVHGRDPDLGRHLARLGSLLI
jgi:hypothetical protein